MEEKITEQNNGFTSYPPQQNGAVQNNQYQPAQNTYQPYNAAQTQNGQYPPQYQMPGYQQPYYDKTREVMSVGSYIGMFFINMIPVVNIICWIVWLVSSNTNKNKKNYIIANIVFSVIVGVVYGVIYGVLIAAGVIASNDITNYFNSFIHLLF